MVSKVIPVEPQPLIVVNTGCSPPGGEKFVSPCINTSISRATPFEIVFLRKKIRFEKRAATLNWQPKTLGTGRGEQKQ